MNFLKYSCPVLIIMLAVCAAMQVYMYSEKSKLNRTIHAFSISCDSLMKENKQLSIECESLKANYTQHIKLDVTGVSRKGGGVVVNNNLCK